MESQASANRSSFLSYSGSNPDCTAANKVILSFFVNTFSGLLVFT